MAKENAYDHYTVYVNRARALNDDAVCVEDISHFYAVAARVARAGVVNVGGGSVKALEFIVLHGGLLDRAEDWGGEGCGVSFFRGWLVLSSRAGVIVCGRVCVLCRSVLFTYGRGGSICKRVSERV